MMGNLCIEVLGWSWLARGLLLDRLVGHNKSGSQNPRRLRVPGGKGIESDIPNRENDTQDN